MARFKTIPLEDGSAYVQVKVPSTIWALAKEVGTRWGVSQEQALVIILDQMADTLDDTNASVLGATFSKAYGRLLAKDQMPLDGLPAINAGKLHRTARKNSASGFVGVYPNGRNFRAMGRDPDGGPQVTIGTYTTAERAAWARYCHYLKHKMPYGEVETVLDNDIAKYYRDYLTKTNGREPTPEEVLAEVNQHNREMGLPEIDVGDVELPPPQVVGSR